MTVGSSRASGLSPAGTNGAHHQQAAEHRPCSLGHPGAHTGHAWAAASGSPCSSGCSLASEGHPGRRAGAGDVLERNVARLFRERVTLFEEIQLTQPSLMSGKRPLIRAWEAAGPVFLTCLPSRSRNRGPGGWPCRAWLECTARHMQAGRACLAPAAALGRPGMSTPCHVGQRDGSRAGTSHAANEP